MLFSFLRRKTPFLTQIDIHAHWLPAIDDGAKTMTASIEMLEYFTKIGYTKLIATPHVFWEYYPNKTEDIYARFLEVQEETKKHNLGLELNVAAEYYLDDHFEELLNKKEILPLFDNYILVECALMGATSDIHNHIFNISINGYQPILAHPERYLYLKKEEYNLLHGMNCQFQINLLSLIGHYGTEVKKRAEYLIKKFPSFYLGTDAHHVRHLKKIYQFTQSSKYQKLMGKSNILNQEILLKQ